jgi:hypothetical protein
MTVQDGIVFDHDAVAPPGSATHVMFGGELNL